MLSEHGPSTSAARLVALALTADMDKNTLESYAGAERIAKRSGLSERTVRTAFKALVAEGFIEERTKGRGRDCWLKIRRATLPARVAAMIAGTQGGVPAALAGTYARVAANGDASGGKRPHGVPARVAGNPVPEIPKKNPGAASPLPADAGSAAQRRWSSAEVLAREQSVNDEKSSEMRDAKRAREVDRLLRAMKSPEEVARETGKPLGYVLARQRMLELLPQRRAIR